jgi:hypothetical protein
MDKYRENVTRGVKEARWTTFKVFPVMLLIVILLVITGFTLNSLGLIGRTAVEREVFEQSYQRSAALASEIAMNEAQLVEIQAQLSKTTLDPDTRANLEAQASAIRVRISTAQRKQ